MTIVTKGMGAIIKKFGKKTATHMQKQATRHKAWTKMGLKGPKYKIGKKVKGSHRLDEVWTYNKNYKEKAEGGRIGFAEGKYVDSEYYKQKQKRKQATEVKDVTGKVIPVEKRPHSTYEGRSAERRRGYRRESKKWHEQAATESQGRNRRTHLGVIRKKGGKV